jgi:hypothetical protein
MNRPKTRATRARFRIIRANGKVEQHILNGSLYQMSGAASALHLAAECVESR